LLFHPHFKTFTVLLQFKLNLSAIEEWMSINDKNFQITKITSIPFFKKGIKGCFYGIKVEKIRF